MAEAAGPNLHPRLARTLKVVRTAPRLRGGLASRLPVLILGLFFFAAGIVALLESRLGLAPWDVLHQGVARHTPLSFGQATILVSIIVLGIVWVLGGLVGLGTLVNAVLVGTFVEILTSLDPIADLAQARVELRVVLLVVGLGLMGVGTALYLGAHLGAGPRDALMLVGAQRTPFRIGVVRGSLEIAALVAGATLGGTVGPGTLAFAVGIGPTVEISFWLLKRSRFVEHDPTVCGVPAADVRCLKSGGTRSATGEGPTITEPRPPQP